MKKYMYFSFLTILSIRFSIFALDTNNIHTINQIIENFTHAWNVEEGKGFAEYYAPDADFVNIFGMAFKGQQEIEVRHIKILETFLKGSILLPLESWNFG